MGEGDEEEREVLLLLFLFPRCPSLHIFAASVKSLMLTREGSRPWGPLSRCRWQTGARLSANGHAPEQPEPGGTYSWPRLARTVDMLPCGRRSARAGAEAEGFAGRSR